MMQTFWVGWANKLHKYRDLCIPRQANLQQNFDDRKKLEVLFYQTLPDFRNSTTFQKVTRIRHLSVWYLDKDEFSALVK
jgi:hypothetical protein